MSNEISSANLKAQYDEHVKRLLKDKGILAYILIYAVKEFRDYSLQEAREAIEGEPEVATREIAPFVGEAIMGDEHESSLPGEGKMTFDIVFHVKTKSQEREKIYINVEAQKTAYPGYELVTRGVIYSARLISQQMGVEYDARNYDGAKKVYSIWICMNSPSYNQGQEKVADTIVEYSMRPNILYSENEQNVAYGRYDLMSAIFVCLKDSTIKSKNKLVGMLSTLLSQSISVEEKKYTLENEYDLPMSKDVEREVASMCNLSEAIEEEAFEKGYKEANKKIEILLLKKDFVIAEQDNKILEQDNKIAEQNAEIAALKKQLAELTSK